MKTDPSEPGKGLFGYRRSAVNQIIADRDVMLRRAAGQVHAASYGDDAPPEPGDPSTSEAGEEDGG